MLIPLETGFGPQNATPRSSCSPFLGVAMCITPELLFHYVGLVAVRRTFCPYLSLSEKPFLTISTVQGFDHMGLKSLIGLEGVYLNRSAGLSSDLP